VGKSLGNHPGDRGEVVPNDRPPDLIDADIRRVEFEAGELEGKNYSIRHVKGPTAEIHQPKGRMLAV